MRYSRKVWRLAVVMVSLLALAACSGTTGSSASSSSTTVSHSSTAAPQSAASSTGVAQSTVCGGVAKVNQALVSLSTTTTVDTTVGDVRAAQLKVINAVNAMHAHVPTADGTLLSQITTANAQLTAKLAGYPDSTTIGHTSDTVQDIKAKAADAQTKTTQLAGKLNCTV